MISFRVEHNLQAAAMVWDKPVVTGQTTAEWQKVESRIGRLSVWIATLCLTSPLGRE